MDRIFLTNDPNTFHYLTMVCTRRTRIFEREDACRILADVINEVRRIHPFKLCGYVFMPDHIHAVINPLRPELSTILRKWKGKSARLILNRLIDENEGGMLERLRIDVTDRRFALWQARSSIIDLVSGKFVRQKISYIHNNPVRAGLCDNPWDWKWSSYRGLHPANTEPMGLQPDLRWQWTIDEIAEARSD